MTDTLADDVGGLFPLEDLPPTEAPADVQAQPELQPMPEPVESAPEPVRQGQPQEQEQKDDKGHVVPLATFLEEKMTARELKKENERLRQEAQARQNPPQPVKIPDPYEDPDGYNNHVTQVMEDRLFEQTLKISGKFAEQANGREVVEAAVTWAQEQGSVDPTFGQRLRGQGDPVGWVVEQYKRDQFFTQYGSDPQALASLQAAQANQGATVAPQPAAQAITPVVVTPKQAPPRSLATARSNAGHQAIPNGAILDSVKFNLD